MFVREISAHKRLRNSLYGVTMMLVLSVSFLFLSYFIPSSESFAANTNSNLLSSLTKQGPIKKIKSALNVTKPPLSATRLQRTRNNIAVNVEKIKNIVNTTADSIRNSIKKIINDTRNALLDLGIKVTEIGSIVAVVIAIFALIRRPWLGLDSTHSPLVKRIELGAYDIDDTRLPSNLRTFRIIYKINTVLVRNKGWKPAINCKGLLNIGGEEVKVYWYASDSSERDGMTINPHSVEYLDLFAIIDGKPSEIFKSLFDNISKLKSYVNSETFTDRSLRQSLNARIESLSSKYKSAEDIPQIIIQDAKDGWRIPGEQNYYPIRESETSGSIMVDGNIPMERTKDVTKITVTSENAWRIQKTIIILDRPADVRGTAIKF